MKVGQFAAKVARLPAVARDGWRYPALRLQAETAETPVDALSGLGFDRDELHAHERDFDALAPDLYAKLSAAARMEDGEEAGEAARRAKRPSESSRNGKKLLYLGVRALRPEVVVETGTFNGAATSFLLRALEDNERGKLVSFDLPGPDALGLTIPPGREPGWIVPLELRHRLELVLGDVRRTLAPRLAEEAHLDVFVHDSLHTTRHMLFEFRLVWPRLPSGGLLLSDDVFWNPAFWLFTRRHRVPFRHIGTMGVTRKPVRMLGEKTD